MSDEIKNLIEKELTSNKVCLFMKGTADVPQCGFSSAVVNVLKHLEVDFKSIDVLENLELREEIKKYSDWPTIPQLYINKKFIGGCDIVKEMFEKNELQSILEQNSIPQKKQK